MLKLQASFMLSFLFGEHVGEPVGELRAQPLLECLGKLRLLVLDRRLALLLLELLPFPIFLLRLPIGTHVAHMWHTSHGEYRIMYRINIRRLP